MPMLEISGRARRAVALLCVHTLLLPALAAAAQKPYGAESPQALVERLKAAAAKDDFGEVAACIAPEERAEMAVALIAGAGMMSAMMGMGGEMAGAMAEGLAGEEMTAEQKAEMEKAKKAAAQKGAELQGKYEGILKKHGLADKLAGDAPALPEGADPGKAARELLKGVDDVALVEDLMGFLSGLGEEGESKEGGPVPAELGEVKDFKVEGDKAMAKAGDETVEFVKVDGRWYYKPSTPMP